MLKLRSWSALCFQEFSDRLAAFATKGDRHAEAAARNRCDIFSAEATAAVVAGNVEARNRFKIFVERILVSVGDNAAAGDHRFAENGFKFAGVIRCLVHREQNRCVASELLVGARFAVCIVLLDLLEECLGVLPFQAHLAGKAFKGVICDILNGNHGSALRAVVFLFFFGIGALEFAVCFIE
mgnify:CR=1 FL=1